MNLDDERGFEDECEETPVINVNLDARCSRCSKKGATPSGLCLKCAGDSIARFPVPSAEQFGEDSFLEDQSLAELGDELINEYSDFRDIQNAKIVFLWKMKGGKSGGKLILGKCQKPSGLLKHFSNADFVVWLAADHANQIQITNFQIRALLFHELKHADVDPESGEYVTVGHDFEGFKREIEVFGFWKPDIQQISEAFRRTEQGQLFGEKNQ